MKRLKKLSSKAILQSLLLTVIITILVWLPTASYLLLKEAREVSQFIEEDTLVLVTKLSSGVSAGYDNFGMFRNNPNLFYMYSSSVGDRISFTTENKITGEKETVSSMHPGTKCEQRPLLKQIMIHVIAKHERSFFDEKVPVRSGLKIKTTKDKKAPNFLLNVTNTFQHKHYVSTLTIERDMKSVYTRYLSQQFNDFKIMFWIVLLISALITGILLNRAMRFVQKVLVRQSEAVAISHGDAPNLGKGNGYHFEEACKLYIDLGKRLDEESERSINALSDVSHSVATHLAEIKQAIDLIDYYGLQEEEAVMSQIKRIENNSTRIREINSTVVNLTKIEGSKIVVKPQVFELQELINLAVDFAKTYYPSFKIENPIIGNSKRILIQREHFLLIVEALVQNAVKYSHESEKKIVIKSMDHEAPKGKAQLVITNWGIGVPKGEESRIFERYYRGSNTFHSKSGVGLGLHMVYKLLNLYDADIKVESVREYDHVYKTSFIITFKEYKDK